MLLFFFLSSSIVFFGSFNLQLCMPSLSRSAVSHNTTKGSHTLLFLTSCPLCAGMVALTSFQWLYLFPTSAPTPLLLSGSSSTTRSSHAGACRWPPASSRSRQTIYLLNVVLEESVSLLLFPTCQLMKCSSHKKYMGIILLKSLSHRVIWSKLFSNIRIFCLIIMPKIGVDMNVVFGGSEIALLTDQINIYFTPQRMWERNQRRGLSPLRSSHGFESRPVDLCPMSSPSFTQPAFLSSKGHDSQKVIFTITISVI